MWKLILLTLLQCLLLTGGQVLLKFALLRMMPFGWNRAFWTSVFANWQFAACGLCFALASLLWMYIIRVFPLSMALPLASLSYVFGMLAAIAFFHEEVSFARWMGVLLIMVGCSLSASAQRQDEAAARQRITLAASRMKTMQCDFVQTKQIRLLNDKMVSRGKMYYRQPSQLRWEYTSPYTYVFILNDQKVLLRNSRRSDVIDVRQNRMFSEIARIMMNSVVGKSLTDERDFQTTLSHVGKEWVAVLVPRRKEMRQLFARVVLHFPDGGGLVSRVELIEPKGDQTLIELKNIRTDETIADRVFAVE